MPGAGGEQFRQQPAAIGQHNGPAVPAHQFRGHLQRAALDAAAIQRRQQLGYGEFRSSVHRSSLHTG